MQAVKRLQVYDFQSRKWNWFANSLFHLQFSCDWIKFVSHQWTSPVVRSYWFCGTGRMRPDWWIPFAFVRFTEVSMSVAQPTPRCEPIESPLVELTCKKLNHICCQGDCRSQPVFVCTHHVRIWEIESVNVFVYKWMKRKNVIRRLWS